MAPPPGSHHTLDVLTTRRKRIVWMSERRAMTAREIGRELGLTIRTVQRHLSAHRRGVPPKCPGMQMDASRLGEMCLRVVAMAVLGMSTREIATTVGRTPRTIRYHLERARAVQQP